MSTKTKPRIIKKYPNRRLYDLSKRSYITLNDIKLYVLAQLELRVIDARTEEDLTQSTLLQVITENQATANGIFSTEILQNMIRLYNENMQKLNPFAAMSEFNELQRKFWESLLKKEGKK